jgi:hypothetical protein
MSDPTVLSGSRPLAVMLGAAALIAALVGLAGALSSAYLGFSLVRPVPYWDQWYLVGDYFDYVDGKYPLSKLWAFHNEHRIFLSRLLFFVDARYFAMSNGFNVVANYSLLALSAAVVSCWVARGAQRLLAFPAVLGMLWATAQWENLWWGFQHAFGFVHLLALLALALLWCAMEEPRSRRSTAFLLGSLVADFLCVYSLGVGVFLGGAAILLAVQLRRVGRPVVVFVCFHALISIVYLQGLQVTKGEGGEFSPLGFVAFALRFIGSGVRGIGGDATLIMGAALLALAGLLLFLVLRAGFTGRAFDRRAALFLAFGSFAGVQAIAAAFTRHHLGTAQATVPRYATPALFFAVSLLAAAWLLSGSLPRWRAAARIAILLAAAGGIVAANAPHNEFEWKFHARRVDLAGFAMVNGIHATEIMRLAYAHDYFDPVRDRLAKSQLGPFAEGAEVYRPPLNAVAGFDFQSFTACRFGIDEVRALDASSYLISGWALAPHHPTSASWILAFDSHRRLIGFSRASVPRPDLSSAFGMPEVASGFELPIKAARLDDEDGLILVAIVPGSVCGIPVSLPNR